jgi:putative ABC transport system ATP-binding protein
LAKSANLIEAEGIEKTYSVGSELSISVLRGVDLTIKTGDYTAITGPSGSGKSTLLHLLGCLDKPTKGTIRIEGADTSKMSEKNLTELRCQKIGFIFQTFNLIPSLTALENVELPTAFLSKKATGTTEKGMSLLKFVGLEDRSNHTPQKLSVGQIQRVAIARALVNDPEIILADEPTGNLDSKATDEVMAIFDSLNHKGVTVVVVTHNPHVAEHANCLLEIKDGLIVRGEDP